MYLCMPRREEGMKPTVALVCAVVILLSACSPSNEGVDIVGAYESPTLSPGLELDVDACYADIYVDVDEGDTEITIRVTTTGDTTGRTTDTCLVGFPLSSPLGDRSVIDAFDGQPLEVQRTSDES
jgi:hypothetical protein